MLYPQNGYRASASNFWSRGGWSPQSDDFQRRYVLLIYSKALGYDRQRQQAVWSDGRTKPADEILLQPEALLLRIR